MPTDDDDDDIIIIRRPAALIARAWRDHGTKILGYITVVAGAIAVMDPQLLADTLGPNAVRWALLISGVATALRGHTNTLANRRASDQFKG